MLLTVLRQLLHCNVSLVALDLIPEAEIIIPGIFTSLAIWSDCKQNLYLKILKYTHFLS